MHGEISIFAALLFLVSGCAAERARVPVTDVGVRVLIVGRLSRPIGEEVVVQGHKLSEHERNGPLEAGSFLVASVGGERLAHPVIIRVRGIDAWRESTEATIRGYEVGTVRFERLDDANFGPDDPRFTPHQVMWMHFEPLEIVKPKNLKIAKEAWSFY